jgi:hypothetical protein
MRPPYPARRGEFNAPSGKIAWDKVEQKWLDAEEALGLFEVSPSDVEWCKGFGPGEQWHPIREKMR